MARALEAWVSSLTALILVGMRRNPRPPLGYLPYGERKPYVVADILTELNGPRHGVVTLPHHLDWSGNAEYDLSQPSAWPARTRWC